MSGDDRDLLAGTFVLGLLNRDERANVSAALVKDDDLRARVAWWERKLGPLVGAGPVPVPSTLWARIAARL